MSFYSGKSRLYFLKLIRYKLIIIWKSISSTKRRVHNLKMLPSVLTIQSVKVPACLHVMIHRMHCLGIQLKPAWSIAAFHWNSLCSKAEARENVSLSTAAQMSSNQEMTACTPVNKCIPWEAFLRLS